MVWCHWMRSWEVMCTLVFFNWYQWVPTHHCMCCPGLLHICRTSSTKLEDSEVLNSHFILETSGKPMENTRAQALPPRDSDSVGDGKEPGISIFKSLPGNSTIWMCSLSENNCPRCREGILCQFFSKYEPWTSSASITLRLVRNAEFWSTPQNYWMGNSVVWVRPAVCGLRSLPGDSEACAI